MTSPRRELQENPPGQSKGACERVQVLGGRGGAGVCVSQTQAGHGVGVPTAGTAPSSLEATGEGTWGHSRSRALRF